MPMLQLTLNKYSATALLRAMQGFIDVREQGMIVEAKQELLQMVESNKFDEATAQCATLAEFDNEVKFAQRLVTSMENVLANIAGNKTLTHHWINPVDSQELQSMVIALDVYVDMSMDIIGGEVRHSQPSAQGPVTVFSPSDLVDEINIALEAATLLGRFQERLS